MPAPTGGQWTAFFVDLQFEGKHIMYIGQAYSTPNTQDQRRPNSMGGPWATMEPLSSPVPFPSSQIPSLSMNARRRSAWERLCRSTPTRNTCWQPRNTVGLRPVFGRWASVPESRGGGSASQRHKEGALSAVAALTGTASNVPTPWHHPPLQEATGSRIWEGLG